MTSASGFREQSRCRTSVLTWLREVATPSWARTAQAKARWEKSWPVFISPDEGRFEIEGVSQRFRSPLEAQSAGVGIVHQELSFCPNLSVAENICLSHLPRRAGQLDWRILNQRAEACLAEIGLECDVREELGRLSTGQIQMVQIAAALATGARILVMDEPTSSLSAAESQRLEELIKQLRSRGVTILYVSHRMDEIFRLCDTVTVLRDGRHVSTMPLAQTNEDELVHLMIGRAWQKLFPDT